MSETEEPPAKVLKIDNTDKEHTQSEEPETGSTEVSTELVSQNEDTAEEGQEEWLSEGVLTDDDYVTNTKIQEQNEETQVSETNQDDTGTTYNSEEPQPDHTISTSVTEAISEKTVQQNIEDTLNRMDGSKDKDDGMQEDLDAFLVKNSQGADKRDADKKKEEKDDGNDTDDLLRMLGEDDNKTKKKLTKTVKDLRNASKNQMATSDEEEIEYKESSMKKVKQVKTAISKKTPPKAVPEDVGDGDDDATDASSDEATKKETVKKKLYNVKKPNILSKKLPPTQNLVVVKKPPEPRQILNIVEKNGKTTAPTQQIVTRKVINKTPARSILKTSTPAKMVASTPMALRQSRQEPAKKLTFQPPDVKTPAPFKSNSILKTSIKSKTALDDETVEDEEMGYEEELDSDFEEELSKTRQRIMRPEQMEEDMLSDGDSPSEDGSLYDELPSSDSEDIDDWFQIDIRSEKASDYLPLLGTKAREMLLEEKSRVAERINNLRQSLSALTESGKRQAEHLRTATMNLAEIDDMLKTT